MIPRRERPRLRGPDHRPGAGPHGRRSRIRLRALTPSPAVAQLAVVVVVGLAAIGVFAYGFMWSMSNTGYDVFGAMIIGPVLLIATFPLARHVARTEDDPRLVHIIMWALVLKFAAALLRYYMTFEVYGSGDAMTYIREGGLYAEQIRSGDFVYRQGTGGSDGTHFIRRITGYVFAITGTTTIGGFFVFSWLSFWGLYFFYRAFRIGVPDGRHRRYAVLVFFTPSLLYWPSSVGKEAWMILTLGIGAYGVARLLTRLPGGYLLLALGLAGSAAVRPHMTVLLAAGLAASFILRRSAQGSVIAIASKGIGVVAIGVAMVFAIQAAEERFGVEGEGVSGAGEVIEQTSDQTSKGGSEFEAEPVDSILDLPSAIFTVMFRPLPHEAHNAQALASSFEGIVLMGLFVVSWPRLRRLPRECWRSPYVTFACAYSVSFMIAFASFGNFGILARQRAQLFPLALIVLALPTMKELMARRDDGEDHVTRQGQVLPVTAEPELVGPVLRSDTSGPEPLVERLTQLMDDHPVEKLERARTTRVRDDPLNVGRPFPD